MKGKFFVEVVNGRMISQGIVTQQVGAEHWECQFAGQVPISRIVPVQNMRAMILFHNEEAMNQWIALNSEREPVQGGELSDEEAAKQLDAQPRVEESDDPRIDPTEGSDAPDAKAQPSD